MSQTKTTSQSSPSSSKRVIYFDFLRIAAMIAVIIIHVAAQNLRNTDIGSFSWNTLNIYDSLVRWGVPIFVMISGSLFLSKEQPIKKLYKKNVLKIIILIILWTIIYSVFQVITTDKISTAKDFFINLATEPYYLWFLYMIVGLYIVTPLLRKITINAKLTKYFLVLAVIFAFIIPETINIIALKSEFVATLINNKLNIMSLYMVLGFTGYYILGYYVGKKNLTKKQIRVIYFLGIIGTFFTILATAFCSSQKGELVTFFYDNLTINVAAMGLAVFVFFKQHFNFKSLTNRKLKCLHLLSRCSLGVYLIHIPLLEVLNSAFNINSLSFNPVLSVPLLSLLILFISYFFSILIYKIPFIGKWIV